MTKDRREAKLQTKIKRWLDRQDVPSMALEYKHATTPTTAIPFASLSPHQKRNLLSVKHKKLYFKIPDAGWENPFDAFVLSCALAYVVVSWDGKECYFIDIEDWVEEEATALKGRRKSLTQARAALIGRHVVLK